MTGGASSGTRRKRDATMLSDDEIDRRVSDEIMRALSIANLTHGRLVGDVADRMATEHLASIPRSRIREVVGGLIADGTVQEYDAARIEASGLGCPCCTGGRDAAGAGRGHASAESTLHAAGSAVGYPVAHAAYRLMDAWEMDHGILDQPDRTRFIRDLCRRGKYEWDLAAESVRLLIEWRVFEATKGVIAIRATRRRPPA